MLARGVALQACKDLERAAVLIRVGVPQFQRGLGSDVLNGSGEALTAGEDGVRRALLDLDPANQ